MLLLLTACGASSSGDGDPNNGGKTNWLQRCDAASECGALDCIGQVCTLECDDASDCSGVSGNATCGQLIAGKADVCTLECEARDDCADDQFCYKTSCNAPGECRQGEVAACDDVYQPVCGCDGETYGNACSAASAGVGVASPGECSSAECENDDCPPLGSSCEGKLCGDPCECAPDDLDCAPTDEPKYCDAQGRCHGSLTECPSSACETRDPSECGDFGCRAFQGTRVSDAVTAPLGCLGVDDDCGARLTCSIDPEGECWRSSTCLPIDFQPVDCDDPRCCPSGNCVAQQVCTSNGDCPAGEYCAYEGCAGGGVCAAATACGEIYAPVCGCDGQTYENACGARDNDVGIASLGRCAASPCETNDDCAAGESCNKEGCGTEGTCANVMPCDGVYDPVCGCDGLTYGNSCEALGVGVGVSSAGECERENCDGRAACACSSNDDCAAPFRCAMTGCNAGTCIDAATAGCSADSGPVCGCDGATYDDACETIWVGVRYSGACTPGACSSDGDCTAGQHCYRDGCDGPGECRDDEEPTCPPGFEPVCSCGGATMGDCTARNSGEGVDYLGECADDFDYGAQWRGTRISFGECDGVCAYTLRRDLERPNQLVYRTCDYLELDCTRSVTLRLNEAGQQLLVAAQRAFRGASLEEQYGCPDCDDGGASMVYIETHDGMFTQHEYEYSNPPAELQLLDELLLDAHLALGDCSDGMYFAVVGECSAED